MNGNMFSFTFLCKFSWICNFAIFVWFFMKLSPKCRTKKWVMIYTILGSFCLLFFSWERAAIWPQIRPRKIFATINNESRTTACLKGLVNLQKHFWNSWWFKWQWWENQNSMPIHVLQYVIHAQKRLCTHLSFGTYVQKRRVIFVHA